MRSRVAVTLGLGVLLLPAAARANEMDLAPLQAVFGVLALGLVLGGLVALGTLIAALVAGRPGAPPAAWKRRLASVGIAAGWIALACSLLCAGVGLWLVELFASRSERAGLVAGLLVVTAVLLAVSISAVLVCGRLGRRNQGGRALARPEEATRQEIE